MGGYGSMQLVVIDWCCTWGSSLIQSILFVEHPFLSAGHFSAAGSEVCEMTLCENELSIA